MHAKGVRKKKYAREGRAKKRNRERERKKKRKSMREAKLCVCTVARGVSFLYGPKLHARGHSTTTLRAHTFHFSRFFADNTSRRSQTHHACMHIHTLREVLCVCVCVCVCLCISIYYLVAERQSDVDDLNNVINRKEASVRYATEKHIVQ